MDRHNREPADRAIARRTVRQEWAQRNPGWIPVMGGCLLGLFLNILALPIVWFLGSEESRGDRLVGLFFGLTLSFGFVVPVLVAITGD